MKSSELREKFLSYFEKHGHTRVRSSSLVPANDPTLFFTNAGMVQFKEAFLGLEKRDYVRAASSQKCIRVSGKHNDLENVGHTPRHHTFFEMLGNFSFGDYFKEEAIEFAWEFLTKDLGLPADRMWITVYKDDDDAEKLWQKHVPKERIFRLGEKDNFWAMGDAGPCGPCSEILWDFESGPVKAKDFETDRFMEIWNLVFMQFNRDEKGEMKPLAKPSIDTGMGLERLAAVVQGKRSNWDTDLFITLIDKIKNIIGRARKLSVDDEVALRVIADHVRGAAFLIADGVVPSNEGRGYVLRRIMRRAIRYGKKLGQDKPFMSKIAHVVIDDMGDVYQELVQHQHFIEKVIIAEEERFYATLDNGLQILQSSFEKLKKKKEKIVPGDVVFKLYDTYGFPKDLTKIISTEQGFVLDNKGFEKLMEKQRQQARASWKGTGEEKVSAIYRDLVSEGISSNFLGYAQDSAEGKVLAILKDGQRVPQADKGDKVGIIADQTPFYGESGGQAGDIGLAVKEGVEFEVGETKRPLPELIIHNGVIKRGSIKEGESLAFAIDSERRQDIRCNHTATHLLHRALREVLGEHVKQSGSLVLPSRLRFDFSHFEAMKDEELREVEERVNEAVRRNYKVISEEVSYDEAVKRGALAFFGEKYGDRVRMIEVKDFSIELCGGTHIKATGEIGLFKIVSESSIAAGVRRIEAVTGRGAMKYLSELEQRMKDVAFMLKARPSEIKDRVVKLLEDKQKKTAKAKSKLPGAADFESQAKKIGEKTIKLVTKVEEVTPQELRTIVDNLKKQYKPSYVLALFTTNENKVAVVTAVSDDLFKKRMDANQLVKEVSAMVGGKGGGRPDMAQGGGPEVSKLKEALKKTEKLIDKYIGK